MEKEQQEKKEQKPVLTAAQRIERLENGVITLDRAIYNLGRQMAVLQDAVTLLNDKISAMVTALSLGMSVNDETINQINIENKIKTMKSKVDMLLESGKLEKSEEVSSDSFIVVREINKSNGEVVNPRLQFTVSGSGLTEEAKQKLLGKKVGDLISFDESRPELVVEVEEIYTITDKTQSEN